MNELLRKLLFLPPQSSTYAGEIDALHYVVILVTIAGAISVIGVGTWFIVRYRRRAQAGGVERQQHMSLWFELGIAGGMLALFLAWWFIGFRQYMRVQIAPSDARPVYVTGKKWMWEFDTPGGPRSMTTLYVPVGEPVKLIMTSRDVIHSFFVPEFRVKQDVLPGRYTTVWFEATRPGRFPILCTEYCGTGHSTMRGEVVALEPREYDDWKHGRGRPGAAPAVYSEPMAPGQAAPQEPIDMIRQGQRAAAEQGCLRCHSTDGTAHIGPTWAGRFGSEARMSDGSTVRVDEAYLTESMMDPNARVPAGFQAVMPSYQGRISSSDTAAIVEFIRSLRTVPSGQGAERATLPQGMKPTEPEPAPAPPVDGGTP